MEIRVLTACVLKITINQMMMCTLQQDDGPCGHITLILIGDASCPHVEVEGARGAIGTIGTIGIGNNSNGTNGNGTIGIGFVTIIANATTATFATTAPGD